MDIRHLTHIYLDVSQIYKVENGFDSGGFMGSNEFTYSRFEGKLDNTDIFTAEYNGDHYILYHSFVSRPQHDDDFKPYDVELLPSQPKIPVARIYEKKVVYIIDPSDLYKRGRGVDWIWKA